MKKYPRLTACALHRYVHQLYSCTDSYIPSYCATSLIVLQVGLPVIRNTDTIKTLQAEQAKEYMKFYYPERRSLRSLSLEAMREEVRIAIGCMIRD
jgi:hypothetical protein